MLRSYGESVVHGKVQYDIIFEPDKDKNIFAIGSDRKLSDHVVGTSNWIAKQHAEILY